MIHPCMAAAQENTCKSKERGEEAKQVVHEKEQDQRAPVQQESGAEHDFEGGFGGQEDLEDRYATTSGEH